MQRIPVPAGSLVAELRNRLAELPRRLDTDTAAEQLTRLVVPRLADLATAVVSAGDVRSWRLLRPRLLAVVAHCFAVRQMLAAEVRGR